MSSINIIKRTVCFSPWILWLLIGLILAGERILWQASFSLSWGNHLAPFFQLVILVLTAKFHLTSSVQPTINLPYFLFSSKYWTYYKSLFVVFQMFIFCFFLFQYSLYLLTKDSTTFQWILLAQYWVIDTYLLSEQSMDLDQEGYTYLNQSSALLNA